MNEAGVEVERSTPPRHLLGLSAAVAAVVLTLDQLTKHWAVNALADDHVVHVFWTLQFNLAFNSGMAFSQAEGIGPIIGVLALVIVVVLLVSLRKHDSRLSAVAVGMIIGGALGNIADRLLRGDGWLRGSVVDFIDVQWWPIFNVADIGVTLGGVMLVIGALRAPAR